MPQHLPDLGQRSATAQHLGGRSVPQPVRVDRRQSRAARGAGHQLGDRKPGQRSVRSPHPAEQFAMSRRGGALSGQIRHDRAPDIDRQRQPLGSVSLAPQGDFTVAPVDVVEPQGGDLAGA